ncbi:MAG: pyridoxal-dependent decarboxylase [Ktedonobacteraceae bacterium]
MQKGTHLDFAQHSSSTHDMDPEAFRRHGYAVIDWIAEYFTHIRTYPVLARSLPGDIRRALPTTPPGQPEAMKTILSDIEHVLLPGITHWNAPGFMAYFGTTGSGPGILGELIASALNVNAMLWRTSPAATELEQVCVDWVRQMLGLPQPLFGLLHDSSSNGVVYALAAAREAQSDLHVRQQGLSGRGEEVPQLRYYASQEAHSSVERAGIVLGVGQKGLRKIGVDCAFRMDVQQLEQAILEDRAAGIRPFSVVATVGTTSSTSVDSIAQIAEVCTRNGLWLHVDAAYGGTAAMVPEMRWVLAGCERADSLIVNPHKWLFTPFDCSILYTRHPHILKDTFSLLPDYLSDAARTGDAVPNLMEYSTALTHRFRALKLWMILRYFGQAGIVERIREHVRLARMIAGWIDESPDFERLAPTSFSVVCLRAHPPGMEREAELDTFNERLVERVNATGHFYLSPTRLHGRYSIRIAVGNLGTSEQDVRDLWQVLQVLQSELRAEQEGRLASLPQHHDQRPSR